MYLNLKIYIGIYTQKNLFKCEFCKKEVTSKQMLTYHLKVCKEKEKSDFFFR